MVRALLLGVVICAMYSTVAALELYSDKYDYIDVEAVLANDPLREQYYDCFMDTKPCLTDDAVFFKGNFPEAIATKCMRCTDRQKEMFNILVDWYVEHAEDKWKALVAKFLEEAKKMNIEPVAA